MSNPRTSISDLELQGSPNLPRALRREKAEADAPPLAPETKTEIEKLDALIAQAMKNCGRGATFRGKKNPAFEQLSQLIRARDLLQRGNKKSARKSAKELLAEADRLLAPGAN